MKANIQKCLGCDEYFIPHGGENCCTGHCSLNANLAICATEHSHLSLPKKIHNEPNPILRIGSYIFYESEQTNWEKIVREWQINHYFKQL